MTMETHLDLLTGNDNWSYDTRSQQGLLTITYSCTVTQSKSFKNTLQKAYNWLKESFVASRYQVFKQVANCSTTRII